MTRPLLLALAALAAVTAAGAGATMAPSHEVAGLYAWTTEEPVAYEGDLVATGEVLEDGGCDWSTNTLGVRVHDPDIDKVQVSTTWDEDACEVRIDDLHAERSQSSVESDTNDTTNETRQTSSVEIDAWARDCDWYHDEWYSCDENPDRTFSHNLLHYSYDYTDARFEDSSKDCWYESPIDNWENEDCEKRQAHAPGQICCEWDYVVSETESQWVFLDGQEELKQHNVTGTVLGYDDGSWSCSRSLTVHADNWSPDSDHLACAQHDDHPDHPWHQDDTGDAEEPCHEDCDPDADEPSDDQEDGDSLGGDS